MLESAKPVTAGGSVEIVPEVPAALVCAPLNPAGPVAVTENVYPLPAVRPVNAADVVLSPDWAVGVGVPVPVIAYVSVPAPPGEVHATVKPPVDADPPDRPTLVGAFGLVYMAVTVETDPPTVPVPLRPLYDVIVIGP